MVTDKNQVYSSNVASDGHVHRYHLVHVMLDLSVDLAIAVALVKMWTKALLAKAHCVMAGIRASCDVTDINAKCTAAEPFKTTLLSC